jgi:predicted RNase H-like nuclease (RuvC/YqgF family)
MYISSERRECSCSPFRARRIDLSRENPIAQTSSSSCLCLTETHKALASSIRSCHTSTTMNQFHRNPLNPISEEITPADHEILRHGGTSSNIERLPSRLKQSKRSSTDLRQQIESLVYEVSYLKAELQWQKESRQILQQFQERMFQLFHMMEDALAQATSKVHESERHYLNVWKLDKAEVNNSGMF